MYTSSSSSLASSFIVCYHQMVFKTISAALTANVIALHFIITTATATLIRLPFSHYNTRKLLPLLKTTFSFSFLFPFFFFFSFNWLLGWLLAACLQGEFPAVHSLLSFHSIFHFYKVKTTIISTSFWLHTFSFFHKHNK